MNIHDLFQDSTKEPASLIPPHLVPATEPKAAKYPFNMYMNTVIDSVRAANPGLNKCELSIVIGPMWKELPIQQRAKFKVKYLEEKVRKFVVIFLIIGKLMPELFRGRSRIFKMRGTQIKDLKNLPPVGTKDV